jgi:hypothetical protein
MTTETIEQVTPAVQPIAQTVDPFQPIFEALAKVLVPLIIKELKEDSSFETHIRELANDEAETEIDRYMCSHFEIWDYEDAIKEMSSIDESQVRDIIKGMSFTVDVD